MVRVVAKRKAVESQLDFKGEYTLIDCTSHNSDKFFAQGLSPFWLGRDGGCICYDGLKAWNMENAWQYSKVYKQHTDKSGNPTKDYFKWRDKGWNKKTADRYPQGRGAIPEYSWWKVAGEYRQLGYIEARKQIYIPLYAKLVSETPAYKCLVQMHNEGRNLVLADFDGYNNFKTRPKMSWFDVLQCERRKMGHAFVLAMMLEGLIKVEEEEGCKKVLLLFDQLTNLPSCDIDLL